MIESLKLWMMAFDFTSWMGFLLYWLPLSVCAYGYTVRTFLNYQNDVSQREISEEARKNDSRITNYSYYSPTDTIGTLIGRGLATVLPVLNMWAACLDIAPKLFSTLFDWTGRIFDQPLVPKRKG